MITRRHFLVFTFEFHFISFIFFGTGALAGIIVAAVVVTLIVVGVVLWVHLRRRKSKSQELNVELSSHPPTQPVQTHFNLAMEPEAKMAGKFLEPTKKHGHQHKVLRQMDRNGRDFSWT